MGGNGELKRRSHEPTTMSSARTSSSSFLYSGISSRPAAASEYSTRRTSAKRPMGRERCDDMYSASSAESSALSSGVSAMC